MYHQNYNPLGNVALSTIVAAVPIAVLLYFIALHPHRDQQGVKPRPTITAPAIATGVPKPEVPSMMAPNEKAISKTWRRRSNEM